MSATRTKTRKTPRRAVIETSYASDDDDDGYDAAPPFLPLEEQNQRLAMPWLPKLTLKKVISSIMFLLIASIVWDALFREPEDRWLKPESTMHLLEWVQKNPAEGIIALVLLIAFCIVVLIPLGTPLTLGCGYIYKGAYGWKVGLTIATIVAMGGSALGAVICFLLGRYLMRDTVRQWVKKYPLFDAIDIGM